MQPGRLPTGSEDAKHNMPPEVAMPVSPVSRPSSDHARELADALQLIAHGTADEKVRYIAERDADWFVDHVLDWDVDYVDRDAAAARPVIDRAMLDRAIARIALRDRTFPALQASA
jgi:hypothetical protein